MVYAIGVFDMFVPMKNENAHSLWELGSQRVAARAKMLCVDRKGIYTLVVKRLMQRCLVAQERPIGLCGILHTLKKPSMQY